MNKYWKLIVVGIIIVLSIGTFYIKSALSVSKFPEFVIEKQSGDEREVASVVLDGNYYLGSIDEGVTVTSNGSKYKSELSFLEQLDGIGAITSIRQLREEHRNFMRGKSSSPGNFYEDENYLVYGEVDYQVNALAPEDFHFVISILDKEKDETNSFEVDVPSSSKEIDYMYVEDVQVVDGKLKIFTKSMTRGNEAIQLYTFNVDSNTMIYHKDLFSMEGLTESQHGQFVLINETDPTKAHQNVVFRKSIIEDTEQDEGYYVSEEVSGEYVTYNLVTEEKNVIEMPKELQGPSQIIMFDNSIIYFVEENGKGVVVRPYSIKDEKFKEELKLELQIPKNTNEKDEWPPIVTIKNGKVYVVSSITDLKSLATITIADLKTGDTIYTGKIVPEDTEMVPKDYSLYLTDLQIK